MIDSVQSNSSWWLAFVKISFGISVMALAGGILFSPIDTIVKGYLGLSSLFVVSATITMSKTLRDEYESQRLINKISEAKTQKIIKEFAE